ncbi:PCC domain-containing protein [Kistimonas scapharcae]|uniref:PCC domain-containing protein n=1 Tax=Kistimonas scapharcae TaxID=1036133 RepID=UPI003CD0AC08
MLTSDGSHIHISLSDQKGHVVGGHLKPGAIVHTTAEVALMPMTDVRVTREHCPLSGYRELVVHTDPM